MMIQKDTMPSQINAEVEACKSAVRLVAEPSMTVPEKQKGETGKDV